MTTLQLIFVGAFLFACGFVWGNRLSYRKGWMDCYALFDKQLSALERGAAPKHYKVDEDTHS